jgi:hypothetical protein
LRSTVTPVLKNSIVGAFLLPLLCNPLLAKNYKWSKILTLKDCSGERFPKHKNKKMGYKNPVIYYGKKIS